MSLHPAETPVIRDLASAHALIAATRAEAATQGRPVAEPPPEPVGCCGRGCEGCVWLGWFSALLRWRQRVLNTQNLE